ncbi:MAG: hypothetical protein ACKOW9_01330 [Candidatus Paceibacterota bacterium]
MPNNNSFQVADLTVTKSNTRKGYHYRDTEGNTGYLNKLTGMFLSIFKRKNAK